MEVKDIRPIIPSKNNESSKSFLYYRGAVLAGRTEPTTSHHLAPRQCAPGLAKTPSRDPLALIVVERLRACCRSLGLGIWSTRLCLLGWLALLPAIGLGVPAADETSRPSTDLSQSAPPPLEQGLPFLEVFTPKDYEAGIQNWAVVQDQRGVIYVANGDGASDGVLTFDGVRWELIPVANKTTVRSLALDDAGRLYVGAQNELGYLEPDQAGTLRYVSLVERLPLEMREFADVWETSVTPQGVVFKTSTGIFRIGEQVDVWESKAGFHVAFQVGERYFVRERGRGLLELMDGEWRLLPGGEQFAEEGVYAMVAWPQVGPEALLVASRTQGLLVFDGHSFEPFPTDVDESLKRDLIYDGLRLPDGRLALGTLQGGLYLLDSNGRLAGRLTTDEGLPSNTIGSVSLDAQGGLWLSLGKGLARAAVATPWSHFGERLGLESAVHAMYRHRGRLYAATNDGLFRLEAEAEGLPRFQPMPEIKFQTWNFLARGDRLLIANFAGVYELREDTPRLVSSSISQAMTLGASFDNPARVWVGLKDGLASMRREGGQWIDEGKLSGITEEVRSILETDDGTLWLGTGIQGVLRVRFPAGWQPGKPATVDQFGVGKGLPGMKNNSVFELQGEALFATREGIYRFDDGTERFVPDSRFENLLPDGTRWVMGAQADNQGSLWMQMIAEDDGRVSPGVAVSRDDGTYSWQNALPEPIASQSTPSDTWVDADGTVWFGSTEGIYRYDPTVDHDRLQPYRALLHRVSAGEELLLGGAGELSSGVIPYADNRLRFDFAAASYDTRDANRFQVFLEGQDQGWSAWSAETWTQYANLWEGDYRFRVRARNVYGTVSEEAVYAFSILPPWYRTWWAYLGYLALAGLVGLGALRWHSAALRRHNRELAALVAQRTRELVEQSLTDALTGLRNRHFLQEQLPADIAQIDRLHRDRRATTVSPTNPSESLLFLMVDIDHFKQVNDHHGHSAGDRVLQQTGAILLSVVRESDVVVRWGGEEFLVVARFTDPGRAERLAEGIRAGMEEHRFELGEDQSIRLTCSVGFAAYPLFPEAPELVDWNRAVTIADHCLYAAKLNWRNAWVGIRATNEAPPDVVPSPITDALPSLIKEGRLQVITSRPGNTPPDWQKRPEETH